MDQCAAEQRRGGYVSAAGVEVDRSVGSGDVSEDASAAEGDLFDAPAAAAGDVRVAPLEHDVVWGWTGRHAEHLLLVGTDGEVMRAGADEGSRDDPVVVQPDRVDLTAGAVGDVGVPAVGEDRSDVRGVEPAQDPDRA